MFIFFCAPSRSDAGRNTRCLVIGRFRRPAVDCKHCTVLQRHLSGRSFVDQHVVIFTKNSTNTFYDPWRPTNQRSKQLYRNRSNNDSGKTIRSTLTRAFLLGTRITPVHLCRLKFWGIPVYLSRKASKKVSLNTWHGTKITKISQHAGQCSPLCPKHAISVCVWNCSVGSLCTLQALRHIQSVLDE